MKNALAASHPAVPPVGLLDRLARRLVTQQLAGVRRGQLHLQDASGSTSHGQPADIQATLRIHRPRFFRQAVLGGTLSVAESYVRGDWDCDDLTSLFRIFVRNRSSAEGLDSGLARLAGWAQRLYHWRRDNTVDGSRQNIAAHYDLGNDFYRLWLDETMAYSSGIFSEPGMSLRDASIEKFDRICRRLQLRPSDDVLEIGAGWGGFALHAAKNYGCQVTTTTISREQFDVAKQRIQAAGLEGHIRLLQQDYRDLHGQFDKLVSIEMIEAVGHRYLDRYFGQCGQLLRPDGSLAIQAIVMPERGYGHYLNSVDFIQRYIFPGGCLPSLASILESVGRATDLRLVHVEDFAPHYAETLRRWRHRFLDRLDDVRELGYSDEFIRLWNYYLCYSEAAFEERFVGLLQIQFDKPECRLDTAHHDQTAEVKRSHSLAAPIACGASREPSVCGMRGDR